MVKLPKEHAEICLNTRFLRRKRFTEIAVLDKRSQGRYNKNNNLYICTLAVENPSGSHIVHVNCVVIQQISIRNYPQTLYSQIGGEFVYLIVLVATFMVLVVDCALQLHCTIFHLSESICLHSSIENFLQKGGLNYETDTIIYANSGFCGNVYRL